MKNNTTRLCIKSRKNLPMQDMVQIILKSGAKRWALKSLVTEDDVLVENQPTVKQPVQEDVYVPIDERKLDVQEYSRYVVTSAQNNTPVNLPFLRSLENFCQHNNARLVIIPFRYRNPTTVAENEQDVWYDDLIEQYLVNQRFDLNNHTKILADLSISPTATNPLSGLELLCEGKNAVIPHAKVAMKCVATMSSRLPFMMHTTGCVTEANYSDSKAGKKGLAHHNYSALYIRDNKNQSTSYPRLLSATHDGSFVDLGQQFTGDAITVVSTDAIVMGDSHVGSQDLDKHEAAVELIDDLGIKKIILHDVFDGATVNHHEEHNPFSKFKQPFHSLTSELEAVAEYIAELSDFADVVVVDSNHNDFLSRWVQRTDWRELDCDKARWYLKLANAFINEGVKSAFTYIMTTVYDVEAKFLELDESYMIHNIELGMHGHLGASGARGSAKTFAKAGFKSVTGHTHSPAITDGNTTVGTSTELKLGYMKGLSKTLHSDCLIYENGKRQLVYYVDGILDI